MMAVNILCKYLEDYVIENDFIFENYATNAYFEVIEMQAPAIYLTFEGVPSSNAEYYMVFYN